MPHSAYTIFRSRYEIANDILQVVNEDSTIMRRRRHKTGIGYAARLTHQFTVRYLRGLTNERLLRVSKEASIYQCYEITPKGLRYLQVFAEIEDDLKPLNNDVTG